MVSDACNHTLRVFIFEDHEDGKSEKFNLIQKNGQAKVCFPNYFAKNSLFSNESDTNGERARCLPEA